MSALSLFDGFQTKLNKVNITGKYESRKWAHHLHSISSFQNIKWKSSHRQNGVCVVKALYNNVSVCIPVTATSPQIRIDKAENMLWICECA